MKPLEKILSKIFRVRESSLSDDSSQDTIASWDSMTHLLLVSELENQFGLKFTTGEVTNFKTVLDIKKALESHGIDLNK
jgi:acyl carrier protein